MFDAELAREFGLEEAVMINRFAFWIQKNEANGLHFHEGRYWTYNSYGALCTLFPFWTLKQIRRIVASCERQGLLVSANFNEDKHDRTKWYALGDNVKTGNMEQPKRADIPAQTGRPLPVYNTVNKETNIDKSIFAKKRDVFVPPTLDEVRQYVLDKGKPLDPVMFFNFYESKGWMVGKNRMKNWHAAVETWLRKDRAAGVTPPEPEKKEDKYYQ